ncbi:TetR/AcrR family transcriptional regulator [Streptacidiphilus pinicola]|uniref:TetR/AcrR family transcriptional regulator n=1 Tax=Streptacidiphilus pinicola TaxID=2219663 RepID=A0A2X0IC43_9ACTN|nr:TetR/AcrR family transcriptional regulator [Streptacidiphilus pinicola]RAG80941.1 TetR/AcrR family transcriptional regulator [Streptacidiphilus pinicola]
MPRVSLEHSEARRRQILAGARRCFSANGFHATSMQDLLNEIGLSAGAFYRYFSGKEELIRTIATETLADVTDSLAAHLQQHDAPLPELLASLPTAHIKTLHDDDQARLIVQIWTEAMRDDALSDVVRAGLGRINALLEAELSERRRAGELPADADPAAVARVIMAALQGFIVQRAAFKVDEPELFASGLSMLFRG